MTPGIARMVDRSPGEPSGPDSLRPTQRLAMHSARRRQAYELRELAFIDPDKRHAFSDPEFRAILLEYDAAFEWSSDDPWLDAVAEAAFGGLPRTAAGPGEKNGLTTRRSPSC
jgi:hypothetical protein